ncbi:DUF1214 domain-containing protein [Rhodopirellula sp. ICT_H3.1]|uniref:DUF1214 domain-containing protein n=1 Tax=Aporhodopirellula aestuarii TaxID=2950107 RepID=A0ABT0TXX9_9BACT|nr:DUF1214 domain-containing protein [Aporhodopirellula aestuarii]
MSEEQNATVTSVEACSGPGGNINVGSTGKPDVNANGSVDIYFSPRMPGGKKCN